MAFCYDSQAARPDRPARACQAAVSPGSVNFPCPANRRPEIIGPMMMTRYTGPMILKHRLPSAVSVAALGSR
eukprot:445959-Hanusia_phi.AAC.1